MKKGTVIECIKTVEMRNVDEITFTKGRKYTTYPYTYKDGWEEPRRVICAKNDQNSRHIIRDVVREDSEEFFNTHFKVVGE
ncbi:hypothetical protein EVJ32_04815 [Exiguobacterium sp. SH5S4]|uniref:hypothetical protein n=1 Tax=Exiguobacterium sp. SH5S4 TaxID=2510961 RepID=UPI00103E54A7|nr:hypothetical protein [Exiguobacterium sp. SH5S4]TCI26699.1 hypothetical protein EVJ32_04815 [Exiguobacterium sp. SH5S4]